NQPQSVVSLVLFGSGGGRGASANAGGGLRIGRHERGSERAEICAFAAVCFVRRRCRQRWRGKGRPSGDRPDRVPALSAAAGTEGSAAACMTKRVRSCLCPHPAGVQSLRLW